MGIHLDERHGKVGDVAPKEQLQQTVKDFIEEVEKWDLEPKLASLWWPGASVDEINENVTMRTQTKLHRLSFEKKDSTFRGTSESHLANRKKVWKTDCRKRTKHDREMQESTEAKTCRGGENAKAQ